MTAFERLTALDASFLRIEDHGVHMHVGAMLVCQLGNVPGPPFPLYLLGARVEHVYPLVPLFQNQGLGIALFSYDGKLNWGLQGDWQQTRDMHLLVDDLHAAFDELRTADP